MLLKTCPNRLLAVLLCLPAAAMAAPPRYAAMLANGQRLEGAKLSDWHDIKAMPRLDGVGLMEPTNPLRWLRDRTKRLPELPTSYIEFHNGDRLPGAAIDYRSGTEDRYDPLPPHLVVRAAISFEPPENRQVSEVRVVTSAVRRIVWQRLGRRAYQPGTAFYRDGRSVAFRAIRFSSGEIHLLLPDGDRRIDWSDLAELHMPAVDPWTAWFDQLAQLCPNVDTRLYEIETAGGSGCDGVAGPAGDAVRRQLGRSGQMGPRRSAGVEPRPFVDSVSRRCAGAQLRPARSPALPHRGEDRQPTR